MKFLAIALALTVCCTPHSVQAGTNTNNSTVATVSVPEYHVVSRRALPAATITVVDVTITVFRVGVRTDIYVNLDETNFIGDGWDELSTIAIFDMIAHAAVAKAILLGELPCAADCGLNAKLVRVVLPSCATRIGSGAATHFKACGGNGQCVREFKVCCPIGLTIPTIEPSSEDGKMSTPGDCGSGGEGCERTCQ